MACHHGVEGPCIVCEAVARKKAEPRRVEVIPLHIQSDSESGGSLCGLDFTECLFSNLASHDEERFCRRCLAAHRRVERLAAIQAKKAWRARPLKEKVAQFHYTLRNPGYGIVLVLALYGATLITTIGTVALVWHLKDFETAVLAGLLVLFGCWWAGVRAS